MNAIAIIHSHSKISKGVEWGVFSVIVQNVIDLENSEHNNYTSECRTLWRWVLARLARSNVASFTAWVASPRRKSSWDAPCCGTWVNVQVKEMCVSTAGKLQVGLLNNFWCLRTASLKFAYAYLIFTYCSYIIILHILKLVLKHSVLCMCAEG